MEKEKIQKRVNEVQANIKATEERASKEFEEAAKR